MKVVFALSVVVLGVASMAMVIVLAEWRGGRHFGAVVLPPALFGLVVLLVGTVLTGIWLGRDHGAFVGRTLALGLIPGLLLGVQWGLRRGVRAFGERRTLTQARERTQQLIGRTDAELLAGLESGELERTFGSTGALGRALSEVFEARLQNCEQPGARPPDVEAFVALARAQRTYLRELPVLWRVARCAPAVREPLLQALVTRVAWPPLPGERKSGLFLTLVDLEPDGRWLERLLKAGVGADLKRAPDDEPVLLLAFDIEDGHRVQRVKALLALGADPHEKGEDGRTSLQVLEQRVKDRYDERWPPKDGEQDTGLLEWKAALALVRAR